MNEESASRSMAGMRGSLEKLDYVFQPSLVTRAANAVVIALWYHEDVFSYKDCGIRKLEEDRVIDNVESINIPKYLKQIILLSVRPVREQIKHWKSINGHLLSGNENRYEEFAWTSMGLIDSKATADNIISGGQLQPVDAFKLACINCTLLHIFKLWPLVQKHFETITLPDNFDFLPDETIIRWVRHQYILEPEVLFWVNCLKKGYQLPDRVVDEPFFRKAYLRSFTEGNMSALKFFFERTDQFRNLKTFIETSNVIKTLNRYNKIPVVLFLLSCMDSALKEQFLKSDPVNILLCFLEWPLHEFFMLVADKVGPELEAEGFSKVFQAIIQKFLQYENEAALYRSLFTGLWRKTPAALKSPCLHEWIDAILTKLFSPRAPNDALALVSNSICDVEKLCSRLLHEADTLLDLFIEENKQRAFRPLLLSFIPTEPAYLKKFEKAYERCTEKYLKMYYCM